MNSTKKANRSDTVNCNDVFNCDVIGGLGIIKEIRINGKRKLTLVCNEKCRPRMLKKCCFLCEEKCDNTGVDHRYDINTKFKIVVFLLKLENENNL